MLTTILLQITAAADTLAAFTTESTKETLSIIDLIVEAGWYIMVPLGILSVVTIYIFIERFFAIKRSSKQDPNFMNQIKDFISDGKIDAAKSLCAMADNPFARMIEKGILRVGKPLSDISTAVENVAKLEIFQLEKNMASLATIAGAAPMIGFLGTVIGMIRTFHEMYSAGNGVEIAQLSGGIMQAMVTTAAGLVIGIIAYVGYNYLVARVENVVYRMEATTIEFMDILQEPSNKQ